MLHVQEQALEIAVAPLTQIGYLQPIGKNVVAVVAQERVAVKEQSVHATNDDQAQAQMAHELRTLDVPPNENGGRCDEQLHVDAGQPDEDPFALFGKGPRI